MSIYIFIFLFGVVATVAIIFIDKKIREYYMHKRHRRHTAMEAEEDGWIKLGKEFPEWGSGSEMNDWVRETELAMEFAEWLNENTNEKFKCRYTSGQNRYIKFERPEDAMAFKLRWI